MKRSELRKVIREELLKEGVAYKEPFRALEKFKKEWQNGLDILKKEDPQSYTRNSKNSNKVVDILDELDNLFYKLFG